jgi:peroxiredoxin-like protein
MTDSHRFKIQLAWQGETRDYSDYTREHSVAFGEKARLIASSAPEFMGDATKVNPEELFVAALSSCQMLTYLALCARKRLLCLRYEDEAEGYLERTDGKWRMTRVVLHPRITLAEGSELALARSLIERAHEECFIANSVTTAVSNLPEFFCA